MPKVIQIRNVPDSVHRALKARAATMGMSLSDYLLCEIERVAERPTLDELDARLAKLPPVKVSESPAEIVRRSRGAPARQEHAFTRREQEGARSEFTPLRQPASSPTALQWGAGLTLAALALAFGFTTLRPGSRRREPEVPAPAGARLRR